MGGEPGSCFWGHELVLFLSQSQQLGLISLYSATYAVTLGSGRIMVQVPAPSHVVLEFSELESGFRRDHHVIAKPLGFAPTIEVFFPLNKKNSVGDDGIPGSGSGEFQAPGFPSSSPWARRSDRRSWGGDFFPAREVDFPVDVPVSHWPIGFPHEFPGSPEEAAIFFLFLGELQSQLKGNYVLSPGNPLGI